MTSEAMKFPMEEPSSGKPDHPSDDEIREILSSYRKIVVVGLSPNPSRPSHGVTKYLANQGYDIFGVRPGVNEVLGHPCYSNVAQVPGTLEIVDVFRRSDSIPELFDELIPLSPKVIWLQEGITHPEAEQRARAHGITVVSDRCILKEHSRLCGSGSQPT